MHKNSQKWFRNFGALKHWCRNRRLGYVGFLLAGVAIACLGATLPPLPPTTAMGALPNTTVTPKFRQVMLAFDPSPDQYVNYRIRYGTNSGIYPFVSEFGTNTIGSISNLIDGTRYYFVAHAWNSGGESVPSNETNWLAVGKVIIVTFRGGGVTGPWSPVATNRFDMTNGSSFYRQTIIEK